MHVPCCPPPRGLLWKSSLQNVHTYGDETELSIVGALYNDVVDAAGGLAVVSQCESVSLDHSPLRACPESMDSCLL